MRKKEGEGSQTCIFASVADGGDAGAVCVQVSRAGADASEVIGSTVTKS